MIQLSTITQSAHPLLNQIEQTYLHSFPVSERRSFSLVRQLIDTNPLFRMLSIQQESVYVGFLSHWTFDTFRYIEHFAIDAERRSGGLGRMALKEFIGKSELPVVLEVELPENEITQRRIKFYEQAGFTLHPHPYFQPSYHEKGKIALELRLMSWGNIITKFECVQQLIHREVYGV